MRFPRTAPDFTKIFAHPKRVATVYQEAEEEAMRPDRYLHWDDLRHREPPEGLTVEEWWSGLKMRRTAQQQALPLQDKAGEQFKFSLTPKMFEQLHSVDLKCGGSVEGPPGALTNPETRDRYYVSSLVSEAITSSQLEGAAVTRRVAKEMLRTGRRPTDDGERMILNNFRTMQRISEWKERDLSVDLVMDIHRTITHGTLDHPDEEGRLRSPDEDIRVEDDQTGEVIHTPPPAIELPERLERMCLFANETKMRGFLHPVIRSVILHFWLAYDHPFVDGNGRTARAIFYWSMLKHGFWLFEFISISSQILEAPKKYYRAFLHTETDGNDLNYFLLHQLAVIEKAIDELHQYIGRKSDELREMEQMLGNMRDFNHRQLALLRYAMKHPETAFTVASHQNSHVVAAQTARNDLEELLGRGLLSKYKQSKAFVYQPVPGLPEKLKTLD